MIAREEIVKALRAGPDPETAQIAADLIDLMSDQIADYHRLCDHARVRGFLPTIEELLGKKAPLVSAHATIVGGKS